MASVAAPLTRGRVYNGSMASFDDTVPTKLHGDRDEPLSRWLWLVKWLLLIPHYIVLIFLQIARLLVTIVAFFAILFTGRYPRALFDFSVGVLRWSWRVGYYGYSALGTDKYPPFTLKSTDYPADFEVDYPEELSRGLVLVKWWVLAIPHYLVVSTLSRLARPVVLVVAVALLFTDRYPPGLFDLLLGISRWGYRVVAYGSLLRDEYPPFRLDQGARESDRVNSPAHVS